MDKLDDVWLISKKKKKKSWVFFFPNMKNIIKIAKATTNSSSPGMLRREAVVRLGPAGMLGLTRSESARPEMLPYPTA